MPLCQLCDALEFPALLYERKLKRRDTSTRSSQSLNQDNEEISLIEPSRKPGAGKKAITVNPLLPTGSQPITSRNDGLGFQVQPGYEELDEIFRGYDLDINSVAGNEDFEAYHQNFGPVIALLDRNEICTLCNMIYQRFRTQKLELTGEYEILTSHYCSARSVGSDQEKFLDRIEVHWTPSTGPQLIGPFLPQQQAAASSLQTQCVMEFQRYVDQEHITGGDDVTGRNNETLPDGSFSARRINPEQADLSLLARWIHLCDELHKTSCQQPIWPSELSQNLESLLVIDVEMMCIVDAPEKCRFVALSYCWGTAVTLKHLRANSDILREPGSFEALSLPATIGDAICLVKGVGERYLWIDALCIIQDDPVSQQVQLAQMGQIYSLAAFTIVAAVGKDASSGLPGVRPGKKRFIQETVQVGGSTLLTAFSRGISGPVASSTWYTRAWTMQERVLSKKCLIFTDEQVYWSCWGATWLEDTNLESVPSVRFHQNLLARDWGTVSFASVEEGYYTLYDDLLANYSTRQLSFQSDIINAFSGITQILSSVRNESFHWGLPESRFDRCLSWTSYGGSKRNNAVCPLYKDGHLVGQVPFPSWSWAAWFGGGHSYIDFKGYTGRLDGEPEIIFYRQEASGVLQEIVDKTGVPGPDLSQANEWLENSGLKELRKQWKGQPRTISEVSENDCSGQFNTGHLHFWTSTAIFYVCRTRLNSSDLITYEILWDENMKLKEEQTRGWYIEMETTDHIPFQNSKNMKNIPKDILDQIEDSAEDISKDILIKEFVVIGRGLWNASPEPQKCVTKLIALIVEWRDSIAYRIGIVSMDEKSWVAVENRIWKQIKMG